MERMRRAEGSQAREQGRPYGATDTGRAVEASHSGRSARELAATEVRLRFFLRGAKFYGVRAAEFDT
jgi:hypothetical protein